MGRGCSLEAEGDEEEPPPIPTGKWAKEEHVQIVLLQDDVGRGKDA